MTTHWTDHISLLYSRAAQDITEITMASIWIDEFDEKLTSLIKIIFYLFIYNQFTEVITEPSENYAFFPAPDPGIRFHVTGINSEVQIALTSAQNSDLVEIHIGSVNNTRTTISRNGQIGIEISTPNIITLHQWNGFRITWVNNIIAITREGERFPFVSLTLNANFPVDRYGLRNR